MASGGQNNAVTFNRAFDDGGALGPARWPAPAKINRFLHITGRREDGYHELQTLFQFLEWGDELEIQPRSDGLLRRSGGPDNLSDDDDLVMHAARALRAYTGCEAGADIHVHKRIPVGSGLGGGSSNAATTLVALNRLWGTRLDDAALSRLALPLGADVPIFVHGHACWAEGVGERLSTVVVDEACVLLVLPAAGIDTRSAFAAEELERDCTPTTIADFRAGVCRNVFEPVARRRVPAVGEALDALRDAAAAADIDSVGSLSGSGSACFMLLPTRTVAKQVQARLPDGLATLVTRCSNTSALRQIVTP